MTYDNVDYQFTKVPTKLFTCLDIRCRSVLFSLIQLSSIYANEDGWFFRSNADLEAETHLSKKVLDGVLDALLRHDIIDFIPQEQGKGMKQTSREYKVNFEAFLKYQKYSMEDCIKNPKYQIVTSEYRNGAFTWQGKEWSNKRASLSLTPTTPTTPTTLPPIVPPTLPPIQSTPPTSPKPQHKVPTNIDTVDNIDNINNKNNIFKNNFNNNFNNNNHTVSKDDIERVVSLYQPSKHLRWDCLKYLNETKMPNVTDIGEYNKRILCNHIRTLVAMDRGLIPKDDNVFYRALNTYMALYNLNKEQSVEDVNTIKKTANHLLKDIPIQVR